MQKLCKLFHVHVYLNESWVMELDYRHVTLFQFPSMFICFFIFKISSKLLNFVVEVVVIAILSVGGFQSTGSEDCD